MLPGGELVADLVVLGTVLIPVTVMLPGPIREDAALCTCMVLGPT